MKYINSKIYINRITGHIVEAGTYQKPISRYSGVIMIGSYVKYGNHGKQIFIDYAVGKDYRYVGKL